MDPLTMENTYILVIIDILEFKDPTKYKEDNSYLEESTDDLSTRGLSVENSQENPEQ